MWAKHHYAVMQWKHDAAACSFQHRTHSAQPHRLERVLPSLAAASSSTPSALVSSSCVSASRRTWCTSSVFRSRASLPHKVAQGSNPCARHWRRGGCKSCPSHVDQYMPLDAESACLGSRLCSRRYDVAAIHAGRVTNGQGPVCALMHARPIGAASSGGLDSQLDHSEASLGVKQ